MKRLPAGSALRFERFDPKVHKEKDRYPAFPDYVQIPACIFDDVGVRTNPKYNDAEFELAYIMRPEWNIRRK